MVIKIKKKLYFKPRKCPVCNRMRLFARHPLARCCKKCHERQRRISRMAERKRQRKAGVYKYSSHYKSIRKKALKEHPYCSLCGSEIRLTVHHVGGGCEHYTVLCDDCHQAYERWNNKRKAIRCIRKIGIRRITNSISLLIWRKQIGSKSLNEKLNSLNQYCTLPAQRWSLEKEENEAQE